MIHHLLAPDLDSLRAFAEGTGQILSTEPGDGVFLAHPPGPHLPRISPADEAIALLPAGPLTLAAVEYIELADRVLCLPGADPALAQALTRAPVQPLEMWAEACPRGAHRRSPAAWERVLRGEPVAGAHRAFSPRPVDLEKLPALATGGRLVGLCWSLQAPGAVLRVSIYDAEIQVARAGTWWVGTKHSHWPKDPAHLARIQAQWRSDFGDRRSEWVRLGGPLDLEPVLVPEGALGGWEGAADFPVPPFPTQAPKG